MDIPDYSGRRLLKVNFARLNIDRFPDGAPCAQVNLSVDLSSEEDPEVTGPSILLALALPIDLATPVQEIEDAALRAAHALLGRASQESLENFRASLEKTRKDVILTPQE